MDKIRLTVENFECDKLMVFLGNATILSEQFHLLHGIHAEILIHAFNPGSSASVNNMERKSYTNHMQYYSKRTYTSNMGHDPYTVLRVASLGYVAHLDASPTNKLGLESLVMD